ncbi:hypothetical protein [Micromonospora sp. HUAS LYJ1]|uniref:hypothetical protein n=1 Tax=Micromonospora sp. HUAS LYJ1 TaxID=3061626 RepID=UPI00267408D9|nr:hypothetical protein [Micromonospora sp. HUAS LYJ1]WKU02985.1 hypothetical protein Q2K16_19025 [Micromonospora sp. HUAS LYJ1]
MAAQQSRRDGAVIDKIQGRGFDAWIGSLRRDTDDYAYGGLRLVGPGVGEADARILLGDLLWGESLLKNLMITHALQQGALDRFAHTTPGGFRHSRVGSARCIVRIRDEATFTLLRNPSHPRFEATLTPILASIGDYLNGQRGRITLTPDFGPYASTADLLHRSTPHVLGIRQELGGCGAKAAYAAVGLVASFDRLHVPPETPIAVIGAAGAMGTRLLSHLVYQGYRDLTVCDIAYQDGRGRTDVPANTRRVPAQPGRFPAECLDRGGVVVATTWGRELVNSDLAAIRPGTYLLLAHNLSVPRGATGTAMLRTLAANHVVVLPGQLLTLAGALAARLEWYGRRCRPGEPFDSEFARELSRVLAAYWTDLVLSRSRRDGTTPYETLLSLTDFTDP